LTLVAEKLFSAFIYFASPARERFFSPPERK